MKTIAERIGEDDEISSATEFAIAEEYFGVYEEEDERKGTNYQHEFYIQKDGSVYYTLQTDGGEEGYETYKSVATCLKKLPYDLKGKDRKSARAWLKKRLNLAAVIELKI
jgi:hypothetical protein